MAEKIRWEWDNAEEKGVKVRLEWVKGHKGIRGNEKADEMAEEGRKKGADKDAFISHDHLDRKAREEAIEEWQLAWDEGGPGRGKHYLRNPKNRKATTFPPEDSHNTVTLSRLRTRHIKVNHYLKKIGKREGNLSELCECDLEEQTVEHILLRCPMTTETRPGIGRPEDIKDLLYTEKGAAQAVAIWDEFERERRRLSGNGDEAEEEGRDKEWGWGELER